MRRVMACRHTPTASHVSSLACMTYKNTNGYSPLNSVIMRSSALAYASLQPRGAHTGRRGVGGWGGGTIHNQETPALRAPTHASSRSNQASCALRTVQSGQGCGDNFQRCMDPTPPTRPITHPDNDTNCVLQPPPTALTILTGEGVATAASLTIACGAPNIALPLACAHMCMRMRV
jgi:hypothetical protein